MQVDRIRVYFCIANSDAENMIWILQNRNFKSKSIFSCQNRILSFFRKVRWVVGPSPTGVSMDFEWIQVNFCTPDSYSWVSLF